MSDKSHYLSAFAKETGRFAVWHPGDPAELGDYGVVTKGEFRKYGNLYKELDCEPKSENSSSANWELTSEGVSSSWISAQADVGLDPAMSAAARLDITFESENSLFVRAASSRWAQIANLYDLAGGLQVDPWWDFSWRLVSGVRSAASLAVLLSTQAGARAEVQGDVPALQQFQLGQVGLKGGVSVSSQGAFSITGGDGPFLMSLVQIRKFPLWRNIVKFSVGDIGLKTAPFGEVKADPELAAGAEA